MPARSTAPESLARLEAVLGAADFRIPGERLIRASGAIIYSWVRNGRVLYVGMSGHGLLRPLSASHDVCWALQEGDQLMIWKVASRQHARHLERRAIRSVAPQFNIDIGARPRRGDPEALIEEGTSEPEAWPPARPEPENLSFQW